MCILRILDQRSDISMFKSWWIQIITGASSVIPRHPCLQHSAALQGTVLLRPIREHPHVETGSCLLFFFSGEMWITKTPVDDAFQKKNWKKSHRKSGVKNQLPSSSGCQWTSDVIRRFQDGSSIAALLSREFGVGFILPTLIWILAVQVGVGFQWCFHGLNTTPPFGCVPTRKSSHQCPTRRENRMFVDSTPPCQHWILPQRCIGCVFQCPMAGIADVSNCNVRARPVALLLTCW